MTASQKLCSKLCREFAQSEQSASSHCRREATKFGCMDPRNAMTAIATHADAMRPRFEAVMTRRKTTGIGFGRLLGEAFSLVRHGVLDRLIDVERSYRGTLLGVRHGADVARMLRALAAREADHDFVAFCDGWLAQRLALIERAEHAMLWFASHPNHAIRSGMSRFTDRAVPVSA